MSDTPEQRLPTSTLSYLQGALYIRYNRTAAAAKAAHGVLDLDYPILSDTDLLRRTGAENLAEVLRAYGLRATFDDHGNLERVHYVEDVWRADLLTFAHAIAPYVAGGRLEGCYRASGEREPTVFRWIFSDGRFTEERGRDDSAEDG
jgi:hypothetical protein